MNTEHVGAKILSEHQGLRAHLRALEAHVRQPTVSDAALQTLREMVSKLIDLCSEHFRLEEQAGLHVQIREASPRLASRSEKLLDEHARLLDALRRLMVDCSVPSLSKGDAEALDRRVLVVIEALREHERTENEVMLDAYWDDLGGESG